MKLFVIIQTDWVDGRHDGSYPFNKLHRTVEQARKEVEEANREMYDSLELEGEDAELNPYVPVSWSEGELHGRNNEGSWDDWSEWAIEEVELED